jgi:hypothetical protein
VGTLDIRLQERVHEKEATAKRKQPSRVGTEHKKRLGLFKCLSVASKRSDPASDTVGVGKNVTQELSRK